MSGKVAVVTGSNKGIGFAIVRGLCKRFEGTVYLTARDEFRGKKAVEDLSREGLKPAFHQLDITNPKSVETFRDFIKAKHGGIDVLVNNAAIAFKAAATEPVAIQAEQTVFVNYFSKWRGVVNVSSSAGHLSRIPSEELRNKLLDPKLTVEGLSALMQRYVDEAKQGAQAAEWGYSSYVVSKVGLSALTRIQQRLLADRDIKVNSCHPGYVDTDMTSHKGTLTTNEGAKAPLYLALDAPDSVQGQYLWKDSSIVDWSGTVPGPF